MTSEQLLAVLVVRHSEMIKGIDMAHEDFYTRRLAALERLTRCAVAMRKCELQNDRVQLERERLDLLREKQRGMSAFATSDSSANPANSSPASVNPDEPSNSSQNLESPESDSLIDRHGANGVAHPVHSVHAFHLTHFESPIGLSSPVPLDPFETDNSTEMSC